MADAETTETATFTPRWPALWAAVICTVWIAILCFPMLSGQFLGAAHSDQAFAGIPYRQFWADEVRRTGGIPLWNPYMFGGLPFVASMHGDMFYPLSFLRLFLRADQALNAWFAIHLVLAGIFTYAFLRTLRVSWTGAVVGALAYQLSGIVASQVSPGHDGKLAVSALLPLLLTGLVLAIQKRRAEGYGLLALVVALDILSPQVQMAQYSLIVAGLFTLWLCFVDSERPDTARARWTALGLAALAVAVGVAITMIQIYPFYGNSDYAARTAGNQGWEYATSWSMPPENIVDWLVPGFTGVLDQYWGRNFAKLHSEYVGAGILALAVLGFANRARRSLAWFLGGVGLLFVLVSLGGHTPFYRLWYAIVPGVKVTRAAGMAFFIPTFVFCVAAALGVERLERREGGKFLMGCLAAAAALVLLGASGALGQVAQSVARASWPNADTAQAMADRAAAASSGIAFGAVRAGVFLALAAGLAVGFVRGRLKAMPAALALTLVIGLDGYWSARPYFQWSAPAPVLYAPDSITTRITQTRPPYRVLDLTDTQNGIYRTGFLMGMRIPNVLGHHGNQLHFYNELLGGKNQWTNVASPQVLDLLAVRYIIFPAPVRVPGYSIVQRLIVGGGRGAGQAPQEGFLLERDSAPDYARVVPAAVKIEAAERVVPTLLDPRVDFDRVVLLLPDAPLTPAAIESLPAPSSSRATVTSWEPGAMSIRLDPAPETDQYLLVAENWYPDWRATVDGREASVVRGNYALITVPVPRGARQVDLRIRSDSYRAGKAVTLGAGLLTLLWIAVPPVLRRRRGG